MNEKYLVFDASSLISLAMNGLLTELRELKKIFNGKFLIPREVKIEIIERPIKIKRFELEALQLNELIKENILELPYSIGIQDSEISIETQKFLELANSSFHEKNKKEIHLIDLGETACLVLSKILKEKGKENVLVIDERTTRMLVEKPENLKKLLQKKLHKEIKIKKENLKKFKGFKIIRSTELIYIAYKNNLMKIKDKRVLDAALYSLKYKGCAISTNEIEKIKIIAKRFNLQK
jgi:hypothetical protein